MVTSEQDDESDVAMVTPQEADRNDVEMMTSEQDNESGVAMVTTQEAFDVAMVTRRKMMKVAWR